MEDKTQNSRLYQDENEAAYTGVLGFLWEIIKVFVLALVIILPIRTFLFQPFFVQGASMEPNFDDGQYLIVNELGYKQTSIGLPGFNLFTADSFRNFQRGDVAVFRYPIKPSQFFIKRTIGLPGETVKISNNKITIINKENPNGFVLDESAYLDKSVETKGEIAVTLEDNEYFMLGDNRMYSLDSRAWGPVPKNDIIGRVALRAWPVNKMAIY